MEKALAIFEKTEEGTKAVFIDQDTIECARLNQRTKKRVEQVKAKQNATFQKRKKAEAAFEQFKAYTKKTFSIVGSECVAVIAIATAGNADLVSPIVAIPVCLVLLGAACVRLGAWIGWVNKQ